MAPGDQRYDPVPPIPSYEEATGGATDYPPRTPVDPRAPEETEGESLLHTRYHLPTTSSQDARARRPRGYHPPAVESDDDDSLFGAEGGDDDLETAQVRREMEEMEMVDLDDGRSRSSLSSWGKRMRFSLPQWRWTWRWRLPRFRIRLGEDGGGSGGDRGEGAATDGEMSPRQRLAALFAGVDSWAALHIFSRLIAIFTVLGFLYLLFMSDLFTGMARRLNSQMFDPESLRMHVQSSVDARRMRQTMEHFTGYAHLAGTEGDYALASDTKTMFEKFGLEDIQVDEYYVYLNYPKPGGRAVEILGADGKPTWSAKLEEDEKGDEKAGRQTLAFHGHSKSGDVRGPLVYANYGSREDFAKLHDSGIDTKGAIALVRYYGSQEDRALKIKAAELAGFAGCLIYSDPADDGSRKGETAPKGRFMPADGVQRGAVSLMSWVVGDVLTPGWGSKKTVPRMTTDQTPGLVKIPSLPLAWRDAQVLLKSLQGHGQTVPEGWAGGVPDVGEWWTGDAKGPVVRLKNEQDEVEKQPIWNVYGRINGIEQNEKKIIIGNHRDSWTFGSADPHSGTAVMMEMARIFGDLITRGWRPLRTIEFKSWDAEEYNLIGSTEYVEQNEEQLKADAMAYINLDTAVFGDEFHAAGSPVFRKLLLAILNRVSDSNANTSLRDLWDRRKQKLEGLGGGSDYVAFQDIVGTSSLDLYFGGDKFPYHSSYENFEWMDEVGDPGFLYHTMLGQVLGLLILELADCPVLPFDMTSYADSVSHWIDDLESWAAGMGANQAGSTPFDLDVLREATDELATAVHEFNKWETEWENSVRATSGWEPTGLGKQRCDYNSRMALFETGLLDSAGIPNRTQFKHVIFGPQLWSGYDEAYFPGIRDAIAAGDWALAKVTVGKVASIIKDAAKKLVE